MSSSCEESPVCLPGGGFIFIPGQDASAFPFCNLHTIIARVKYSQEELRSGNPTSMVHFHFLACAFEVKAEQT